MATAVNGRLIESTLRLRAIDENRACRAITAVILMCLEARLTQHTANMTYSDLLCILFTSTNFFAFNAALFEDLEGGVFPFFYSTSSASLAAAFFFFAIFAFFKGTVTLSCTVPLASS